MIYFMLILLLLGTIFGWRHFFFWKVPKETHPMKYETSIAAMLKFSFLFAFYSVGWLGIWFLLSYELGANALFASFFGICTLGISLVTGLYNLKLGWNTLRGRGYTSKFWPRTLVLDLLLGTAVTAIAVLILYSVFNVGIQVLSISG